MTRWVVQLLQKSALALDSVVTGGEQEPEKAAKRKGLG